MEKTITRRGAKLIAEELRKTETPAEWLTTGKAAKYAGCSTWTIYHNIKEIPHEKRGKLLRFTKQGLSEWIKRRA